MKNLLRLLALAICCACGTGAAQACSCDPITPQEGFDHAQFVFSGKVVQAENHVWFVDVERVWKGREKLRHTVKLMDVFARMDCEFYFELGQRYLIFAVIAKGSREIFFHPQACNWTRPLQSTRVIGPDNESLWVEDLIIRQHGPGEPPDSK